MTHLDRVLAAMFATDAARAKTLASHPTGDRPLTADERMTLRLAVESGLIPNDDEEQDR